MFKAWKNFRKRQKARWLYSRWIHQQTLCFDIGANHGDRTDIYLHLGGRVVAVEPHQECYSTLSFKYESNSRVTVLPFAVGEHSRVAEMSVGNIDKISTLSSEFRDFYSQYSFILYDKRQLVQVITLDMLIEAHGLPYFCKLDIEGYELKALQGLTQAIPVIEFEFNAPFKENAIQCVQLINQRGNYKFNLSTYENYTLHFSEFLDVDEFILRFRKLPDDILTGDIFACLY